MPATKKDSSAAAAAPVAPVQAGPTASWTCERQDHESGDIYWAIHDALTYEFIANVYSNEKHARLIAAALDRNAEVGRLQEALRSVRVYVQDCIENGHDRTMLGNMYGARDEIDAAITKAGG